MRSAEFTFEDNRSGDGHDVITWLEKRGDAETVWSYEDYDLEEYLGWLRENKKRRDGNGFLLWLRKRRISVKHVNMMGWVNVTDEGLVGLSSICSALQSLNLGSCKEVTDAGLGSLAEGCSSLQSLDLKGCGRVSDIGLGSASQGCPMIQN